MVRLVGPHKGMIFPYGDDVESRPLRQENTRLLRKAGFLLYWGALMKPLQIPRLSFILVLFLVIVIFLAGTLRTFSPTRAATAPTATVTTSNPTAADTSLTPTPAPTLTPTPIPTPMPASADTTGIIALAIVIVIIVLVGTTLGGRRPQKNKTIPKK